MKEQIEKKIEELLEENKKAVESRTQLMAQFSFQFVRS